MKRNILSVINKIFPSRPPKEKTIVFQPYSSKATLRDFLYLDSERIRSLTAQLLRGIPENLTTETGKEFVAKSELQGSAAGLMTGQVGGDYRFFKTQNETKSFHHYLYSLFEEQLEKEKMIKFIDSEFDFNQWTPTSFYDGQFIKIQGVLRLTDYAEVGAILEMLPRIMETGMYLTKFGAKNNQPDEQMRQNNKEQEKTLRELRSMQLNKLTELIRSFYGDGVRIKILPNKDHPLNLFAGMCIKENFSDSSSGLSQKYGYEVDANWITLGQVNISNSLEEPAPLSIGNSMEDGIEQLVLAMNQMTRIINTTRFPAITITPISIYRLVGKRG